MKWSERPVVRLHRSNTLSSPLRFVRLPQRWQALSGTSDQDVFMAYPNQGMEIIMLTKAGIERADYLKFRQEFLLVGDPLPDSLDLVRAQMRFWVQERAKHSPRSDEWRLIAARIDDLKHLENTMPRTPSSSSGFIPPPRRVLSQPPQAKMGFSICSTQPS